MSWTTQFSNVEYESQRMATLLISFVVPSSGEAVQEESDRPAANAANRGSIFFIFSVFKLPGLLSAGISNAKLVFISYFTASFGTKFATLCLVTDSAVTSTPAYTLCVTLEPE